MTRLAVTFTLAAIFTASSIVVDAQSGLGARAGGVGGVMPGRGGGGGGGRGGQPPVQGGNMPPAAPSINLPSFPVDGLNRPSFPLSGPLGFGPAQPAPFEARDEFTRRARRPRSFGIPIGYGFGVPGYAPSYTDTNTYERRRQAEREPEITTGTLFVDATPLTALVFVDTAYVGSVDDLQARGGVRLSAGRHWLDLEAPGYDRKTIEITITAGEPLHYRFDLTPTRRAEALAIPPRAPETMYAIPGCYGGNRPPVAANLPKGCDIARVRVLRPQPRTN